MSEHSQLKANCICGKTQIAAKSASLNIGACHCDICRKWGGGPYLAIDCGTDVSIEPKENISVFDSSDWADRGFCKHCGTHLFYRIKQSQQYIVPVGLFDTDENKAKHAFDFDHQVFIDAKPDYYCFANKTEDMTGEEMFAKFAP